MTEVAQRSAAPRYEAKYMIRIYVFVSSLLIRYHFLRLFSFIKPDYSKIHN